MSLILAKQSKLKLNPVGRARTCNCRMQAWVLASFLAYKGSDWHKSGFLNTQMDLSMVDECLYEKKMQWLSTHYLRVSYSCILLEWVRKVFSESFQIQGHPNHTPSSQHFRTVFTSFAVELCVVPTSSLSSFNSKSTWAVQRLSSHCWGFTPHATGSLTRNYDGAIVDRCLFPHCWGLTPSGFCAHTNSFFFFAHLYVLCHMQLKPKGEIFRHRSGHSHLLTRSCGSKLHTKHKEQTS